MSNFPFFRRSAAPLALSILLAASLAATPGQARKVERGLEPAHQPVVSRTDFVFDVAPDANGALSPAEQSRLSGWFDALGLSYGDHVTLAGSGYGAQALQDSIGEVVGRYGLLIEGDAPVTAGNAPSGGVRVVVSRSSASVPSCPSWRDRAEADFNAGLADNYGCASMSNLAAMVADPRDLVDGHKPGGDTYGSVSTKAIKTYQEKAPTGQGDLKTLGGGN